MTIAGKMKYLIFIFLMSSSILHAQTAWLSHPVKFLAVEKQLLENNYFPLSFPFLTPQDTIIQSNYFKKNSNFYLLPLINSFAVLGSNMQYADTYNEYNGMYVEPGLGMFYRYKRHTFTASIQGSFFLPTDSLPAAYGNYAPVPGFSKGYDINGRIGASNYGEFVWKYHSKKYFSFSAGIGKYQIGNGLRSLLLSQESTSYPFLAANVNLGKLSYTHVLCFWNDFIVLNDLNGNNYTVFASKPGVFHYLTYRPFRWWEFGLFESVIWQGQNGRMHRGVEWAYLNPVIFIRPVEFSMGSADNVLAGFQNLFRGKKWIFYQQLMLDEFLLEEIRKQQGWWGNKFAFQTGFTLYDILGLKNIFLKGELNVIRPFTYTHETKNANNLGIQNYSHNRLPLAHPFGANLMEYILWAGWDNQQWHVSATYSFMRQGRDSVNTNLGSNIFLSYSTRTRNYANRFLQGLPYIHRSIGINIQYKMGLNHAFFIQVKSMSEEYGRQKNVSLLLKAGIQTYFNRQGLKKI